MLSKLKNIRKFKKTMTLEQKQRLLKALHSLKEEYTGNVGGETDIMNADSPQVNEDEFTSAIKPERNVVAKTFDTHADFDSYVNQRRGIEMTPKEQQAVLGYRQAKPTQQDKFFVKFETTDDFGNNDTTVVKKLKDGNQFTWTAFSKHETAEEEGKPEEEPVKEASPAPPSQPAKAAPSTPSNQPAPQPAPQPGQPDETELTVDDPIRITKTITFTDDSEGSNILGDFLRKLDL